MSDARPPNTDPGYRGALPPRSDWLARGWVIVVIAIFVSMFVLDILNIPTILLPQPTPLPTPVVAPSAEPSGGESAAPSESGEASEAASPSP
jgi:hypothetical protein